MDFQITISIPCPVCRTTIKRPVFLSEGDSDISIKMFEKKEWYCDECGTKNYLGEFENMYQSQG